MAVRRLLGIGFSFGRGTGWARIAALPGTRWLSVNRRVIAVEPDERMRAVLAARSARLDIARVLRDSGRLAVLSTNMDRPIPWLRADEWFGRDEHEVVSRAAAERAGARATRSR